MAYVVSYSADGHDPTGFCPGSVSNGYCEFEVPGTSASLSLNSNAKTPFNVDVTPTCGIYWGISAPRLVIHHAGSSSSWVDLNTAAPEAADDSAVVTEDTPLTITVLNNDTDADGDALSVARVSQPEHGTAQVADNGAVTYLPALNYNGPDQFSYVVSDGAKTDEAEVSINVTAMNDPPQVVGMVPDQAVEVGDEPMTLDLSPYFSDPGRGRAGVRSLRIQSGRRTAARGVEPDTLGGKTWGIDGDGDSGGSGRDVGGAELRCRNAGLPPPGGRRGRSRGDGTRPAGQCQSHTRAPCDVLGIREIQSDGLGYIRTSECGERRGVGPRDGRTVDHEHGPARHAQRGVGHVGNIEQRGRAVSALPVRLRRTERVRAGLRQSRKRCREHWHTLDRVGPSRRPDVPGRSGGRRVQREPADDLRGRRRQADRPVAGGARRSTESIGSRLELRRGYRRAEHRSGVLAAVRTVVGQQDIAVGDVRRRRRRPRQ